MEAIGRGTGGAVGGNQQVVGRHFDIREAGLLQVRDDRVDLRLGRRETRLELIRREELAIQRIARRGDAGQESLQLVGIAQFEADGNVQRLVRRHRRHRRAVDMRGAGHVERVTGGGRLRRRHG